MLLRVHEVQVALNPALDEVLREALSVAFVALTIGGDEALAEDNCELGLVVVALDEKFDLGQDLSYRLWIRDDHKGSISRPEGEDRPVLFFHGGKELHHGDGSRHVEVANYWEG